MPSCRAAVACLVFAAFDWEVPLPTQLGNASAWIITPSRSSVVCRPLLADR